MQGTFCVPTPVSKKKRKKRRKSNGVNSQKITLARSGRQNSCHNRLVEGKVSAKSSMQQARRIAAEAEELEAERAWKQAREAHKEAARLFR